MQLKLNVIGGAQDAQAILIPGPKFLIGRDAECNLRPRSESVSRHHCVLLVEQGYVGVRDFNSKNGTFVNGERVAGERELKAGDELQVGDLRFGIALDVSIGGRKKSKVKDMKDAVARTADRSGVDVDIDDWLIDDADDQGDTQSIGEKSGTTTIESLNETTEIRLSSDETLPHPGTEKPKVEEDGAKSKDTHSAAMDVLKRLSRERKDKKEKDKLRKDKK